LGEDRPPCEPPAAAAEKHEIVGKFYDTFSGAANVDYGRPIASVNDPKVFRIRAGGWRAAVRYTPEDGVVWLCRALSLAGFHDESDAYNEFGRLFDSGSLLPSEDEQERARGDYFLVGAVLALSQARVNADNHPGQWWAAVATSADGTEHRIGRIYAEREANEAGDYVTRFILLVASPPSDVTLRADWRELGTTSPSRPRSTVCQPGRTVNRTRSLTSKQSLSCAMKPLPKATISIERASPASTLGAWHRPD